MNEQRKGKFFCPFAPFSDINSFALLFDIPNVSAVNLIKIELTLWVAEGGGLAKSMQNINQYTLIWGTQAYSHNKFTLPFTVVSFKSTNIPDRNQCVYEYIYNSNTRPIISIESGWMRKKAKENGWRSGMSKNELK